MVHKRKQASTHVCLSILLVCQSCLAAGVLRRLLLEPGAVFRADKPDETRWDDPPDFCRGMAGCSIKTDSGRESYRCHSVTSVEGPLSYTVYLTRVVKLRISFSTNPMRLSAPISWIAMGESWLPGSSCIPWRWLMLVFTGETHRLQNLELTLEPYTFNILVRLCPSDDRHSWPARLSCRALKL